MDFNLTREQFLIFQTSLIITAFGVLYLILRLILAKLTKRFAGMENQWKHSFTMALRPPLVTLLGMSALALIADLIQSQLFQDAYQEYLNKIYPIIPLFCSTWFFFRWAKQVQTHLLEEKKINKHPVEKSKVDIVAKLFYLALFTISIILGLQILGFNIAALLTIGGVGSVVLGFASKDVVSNFFGGLMIYLTNPFIVGDYIQAPQHNLEGTVESIHWYHILLKGVDQQLSYIPNSIFSTSIIRNISRKTHWTFDEKISIRYKDYLVIPLIVNEIKQLFLASDEFDKKEPIRVYLEHFTDSSLKIATLASTFTTDADKVNAIRQDCLLKISHIITSHGAFFAFPTQTLDFSENFHSSIITSEKPVEKLKAMINL